MNMPRDEQEHTMSDGGCYLYGFTDRHFDPGPALRGVR